MRKPKVVVSGASQAELEQRQKQFDEQMANLKAQQDRETALLQEQIAQQQNIANEQKQGLDKQLQAQGTVNSQLGYNNLLQMLNTQRSVGAENIDNRRVTQANTAVAQVQASNVASEATKATTSRQNLLAQLNRRRLRYGSAK